MHASEHNVLAGECITLSHMNGTNITLGTGYYVPVIATTYSILQEGVEEEDTLIICLNTLVVFGWCRK